MPELLAAIAQRWSPTVFDPDRSVEPEKLLALLEAARWAPSSYNVQPWRFLVFDDRVPELREQARGCLSPGNSWARNAPVLILTVAEVINQQRATENRYAIHDLGLATENLLLQAVAEGLAAHPMAGFDKDRARELFGIPEGYEPRVMIAVGYVPQDSKERKERIRLEIGQIAFLGMWGRSL